MSKNIRPSDYLGDLTWTKRLMDMPFDEAFKAICMIDEFDEAILQSLWQSKQRNSLIEWSARIAARRERRWKFLEFRLQMEAEHET